VTANKFAFIEEELKKRNNRHQLRTLRSFTPLSAVELMANGRTLVNFSSNDYLGLSKHPLLKERAMEFLERYGAGSTASRLICGSYDCFEKVEKKLATLKDTTSALIHNSGFQANVSILPALADDRTLLLSDWLNHNSIVNGAMLSRCHVACFRHNDLAHLKILLEDNYHKGFSRTLIVTESVFSVDGDRCDIDGLIELKEEFQAMLIVDEAHATGLWGERGMGLTCGKPVDITIGTFGKACGSFGAYVSCSEDIWEYLVNCCSGFIYTTAMPPSVVGSIDAALDLIPQMDNERRALHRMAEYLRSSLQNLGWRTGKSTTQIIPVIVGDEQETLALSRWLENEGFLATALRPPTVGNGDSRIRLALSAEHTLEQVDRLIDAFRKWSE
jgi:8-amino-7-oxononanoate synthase